MLYKVITIHGDLNLKNICLSYTQLEEIGGVWSSNVVQHQSNPIAFTATIAQLLQMPTVEFRKMEAEVCLKLCKEIADFISTHQLEHKIDFIASNGIAVNTELSIENNAALAAQLQLPVIGQFYEMNKLLGGNSSLLQISSNFLQTQHQVMEVRKSEAIALLGALRWREAYNVYAEQTGAARNHIAGSIWLGVDA